MTHEQDVVGRFQLLRQVTGVRDQRAKEACCNQKTCLEVHRLALIWKLKITRHELVNRGCEIEIFVRQPIGVMGN